MSTLFFRAGARALEQRPDELVGEASSRARSWLVTFGAAARGMAPVLEPGEVLGLPDLGGLLGSSAVVLPEGESHAVATAPRWPGADHTTDRAVSGGPSSRTPAAAHRSPPRTEARAPRNYADVRALAPSEATIGRLLAGHAPKGRRQRTEMGRREVGDGASGSPQPVAADASAHPASEPRPGRARVSPLRLQHSLERFEETAEARLEAWTRLDVTPRRGIRSPAGGREWQQRTVNGRPRTGEPEGASARAAFIGPTGSSTPMRPDPLIQALPSSTALPKESPTLASPLEVALRRGLQPPARPQRSDSHRSGSGSESPGPDRRSLSLEQAAEPSPLERAPRGDASGVPALLERIAATLSGIEARLTEQQDDSWGSASDSIEWIVDEDLALRLQRVLKRQAQRRGIDLS